MRRRGGHAYLAGAPLLIAHRGGSALAPENTLLAFRRALKWWRADILELDVQPTADGEAVVIHDPTLQRTTDGRGPVAAQTLAQIQRFDAGFRFSPDGGQTFPLRGRGETIPSFDQVLATFPTARVNVEIKDGRAAERVWETIHAHGAHRRVLVAAGERANRRRFVAYAGPISAAREEILAFWLAHRARARRLYAPPVDAMQVPEHSGGLRVVSPGFIQDAHAGNLPVHVWTVNAPTDMERLLAWGVDGIISDRPDRLAEVLHRLRGRPLPPGPSPGDAEPFLERLLRA